MKSIWTATYENNTIKITNTWFSGEQLYVNEVLQDKKFGAISSNLTGHIMNSKNEKELIKATIFGWYKAECILFINDKEVAIKQEK
ncbi:hypothetical protein [Kaistella jeonii]|uniref:Uncharacterized protein n=1 Tax=Kaistella jeonii TaxID=266749 RepID=A0A0C1CXE0_9FLAO|nr:hypothetical protein [Kaistella jeonii]KIA86105.1 hypothetical protein OA86_13870 [Kaistella jeonii]SFC35447.1 hypothetical protein SAMN05421876_11559 [Kaistella jeonii]VEI95366.1 Uncharacterised protein [Kaistella jeonii]